MPAVMILTSSAYPWSSYVMIAVVLLWGWYVGQYPRLPTASHRRRSFMNIVNRNGDRVSPCSVPRCIEMREVLLCGVI